MVFETLSPLERARLAYEPKLPTWLKDIQKVSIQKKEVVRFVPGEGKKEAKRIGVVFSGGQAPGGHNVVTGLFDALPEGSELIGFLGGPSGIINNKTKKLDKALLSSYRNQGGFDLLGSGRTKIETQEQFEAALQTCRQLALDGLVIIGGDDSNTNACFLSEFFASKQCKTVVVGVPKTIDGDLQNRYVDISFGFDTACKVYAEMIGNILRDCLSARKYSHFIRLMGRSASHITLECALKTHPHLALIAEERKSLSAIIKEIADLIEMRAKMGKNYNCILVPEGLIEFIPDFQLLIQELGKGSSLSKEAQACFDTLPKAIQQQLLYDRDPHGNLAVSAIETEKLLIEMVKKELDVRGCKNFSPLAHYFGYEGRAALPSNFDANYCYTLGVASLICILHGLSGHMCYVHGLAKPVEEWQVGALAIGSLMTKEVRKGKEVRVIKKTLVDLQSKPFLYYASLRERFAKEDLAEVSGPIQFFGPPEITDSAPVILGKKF